MANIDIATLAIRVQHSEVEQAARSLGTLNVAGAKTETTFNNVAKASHNAHGGLGNLRQELVTVTRNVLNLNPAVAQTGALLGNLALGAGPMIAILGGVAALGLAYEKLTEKTKKAREEHEKLLNVLVDLQNKERYSLENSLDAQRAALIKLQQQRAAIAATQAGNTVGGVFAGGGGFAGQVSDLDKQIKAKLDLIRLGERELSNIAREAEEDRLREAKRASEAQERELEEYKRRAEKREQIAFDEAQKLALYARVAAGFSQLGVADAVRMGGSLTYSPSVAKLPGAPEDPRSSLAIEAQNEWIRRLVEEQRYAAEQTEHAWLDAFEAIQQGGTASFRQLAEIAQRLLNTASRPGASGGETTGLGGLGSSMLSDVIGTVVPFVSGFTSVVGMFQSAADKQYEAAVRLMEAADQFKDQSQSFSEAAFGTGASRQILALRQTYESLVNALNLLHPVTTHGNGQYSMEDYEGYQRDRGSLDRSYQAQVARIASDFWRDIAEQVNATLGPQGEYLNQQNAIIRKYQEQIDTAQALGATQEDLARIEELRTRQLAALNNELEKAASSALMQRFHSLTGGSAPSQSATKPFLGESEYLRPLYDDFEKYLNAIEATKKAAEESAYWDQIQASIAQLQLEKLTETARLQEDTVSGLRQTYEALKRYSDSLNLSGLSPLSPVQRLAEARNQYNVIRSLAAGGDKSALASLPDAANAFLTESRNVNASGGRYQADFNGVRSFIADITAQYGEQLTTQEKILKELQVQTQLSVRSLDTQKTALVQQLVARAQDHPDGTTVGYVVQTLRQLGYTLAFDVTAGGYVANQAPQGNAPGEGNTGTDSTTYNAAYQRYLNAHNGDGTEPMSYAMWQDYGEPSYANGTRWHPGGMAMVGEYGAELVNMPRGSTVTTPEQFAAPIVAALRPIDERLMRLEAGFALLGDSIKAVI